MNKYLKLVSVLLLVLFLIIYMADALGYYETLAHKKAILTEEKIEEFEKDIEEGKIIDNKEYLEDVEINYRNKLSLTCSSFSSKVSGYFKDGVESVFRILGRLVGN